MTRVGVAGLGVYLPDEVRTNDWWPENIVKDWQHRRKSSITRPKSGASENTAGEALALRALERLAGDPFQGSQERRVMPPTMAPSEMETEAAARALSASGVHAGEIDLLLVDSSTPDYVNVPNACRVHRELHLPQNCHSITTDHMCNAFLEQLALANALFSSPNTRKALLIQSSAMTRLSPQQEPFSPWFGDGATALVLERCDSPRGILASAHLTDGSVFPGVVAGVPGAAWYEPGAVVAYLEDATNARRMILGTADASAVVAEQALSHAGLSPADVDFFACHQGTAWLREVIQERLDLGHARTVDTFSWAASLTGSNIPLVLATAEQEGLLKKGDVVLGISGAAGMTVSCVLLRW